MTFAPRYLIVVSGHIEHWYTNPEEARRQWKLLCRKAAPSTEVELFTVHLVDTYRRPIKGKD
jgi:hypothetical protein